MHFINGNRHKNPRPEVAAINRNTCQGGLTVLVSDVNRRQPQDLDSTATGLHVKKQKSGAR
jgi:hypothetical protein